MHPDQPLVAELRPRPRESWRGGHRFDPPSRAQSPGQFPAEPRRWGSCSIARRPDPVLFL